MFAKDGISPLIIVSSKLTDAVKIANKLIVYLEYVATSVYRLTASEISKMKGSTINTVRYEIVCPICGVFCFE